MLGSILKAIGAFGLERIESSVCSNWSGTILIFIEKRINMQPCRLPSCPPFLQRAVVVSVSVCFTNPRRNSLFLLAQRGVLPSST